MITYSILLPITSSGGEQQVYSTSSTTEVSFPSPSSISRPDALHSNQHRFEPDQITSQQQLLPPPYKMAGINNNSGGKSPKQKEADKEGSSSVATSNIPAVQTNLQSQLLTISHVLPPAQ